jgi:hypothetical protein
MRMSRWLAAALVSAVFCSVCSTSEERPLRVTAVLLDQTYCEGDAELFRVDLKLRLRFENRTDQKLILDKEIGKLYYRIGVARDKEELAARNFESHPILDWFFSDKDPLPKEAFPDAPDQSFAILVPGDSFEVERTVGVFAQYATERNVAGAIRSGVHFLQVELSPWTRPGDPKEFGRDWRAFGRLVTETLETAPLEFLVPPNPKVGKCKK